MALPALMLPMATAAMQYGGGMMQQNAANKSGLKMQKALNRDQLENQWELNRRNADLQMDIWNRTNYGAQREQLEKAGLNVGLMYDGQGQGGTLGNAGGSVQGGQAGNQMEGFKTAGMMAPQLAMMQAQIENIKADTANKEADATLKGEQTPGAAADSRNKSMNADITEATYWEQVGKLQSEFHKMHGEAESAKAQGDVAQQTVREKIEQEQLRTIQMGLDQEATKAGIGLTEAQRDETAAKIDKIVTEIQNMKDLTEIQRQNMLTQRMQVEFNTSTAAQIKQYTSIGTDILNATKGGGSTTINKTNTYERGAINNWGE